MSLSKFWEAIDAQLDAIESEKPDTVAAVIDIIGHAHGTREPGAGFFAGSGGDRQLRESLVAAGWKITWSDWYHHYEATHPATGQRLEYIEGDVYDITEREA